MSSAPSRWPAQSTHDAGSERDNAASLQSLALRNFSFPIINDPRGTHRKLPQPGSDRQECDCGVLEGLKLIGFGVWERRGAPGGRNVTFPARQYSVNGERRSFAQLRPIADGAGQERIRDLVLSAYAA